MKGVLNAMTSPLYLFVVWAVVVWYLTDTAQWGTDLGALWLFFTVCAVLAMGVSQKVEHRDRRRGGRSSWGDITGSGCLLAILVVAALMAVIVTLQGRGT